jgi:hypothetical protein
LAKALADTEDHTEPGSLVWTAQPMGARVDLDDRDALHRIMDADR